MFPGINPREMQKAMKKMGIKQEDIEAQEVIIRATGRDFVFKSPQVSRINMMGQETYQIIGEAEEIERIAEAEIKEEDIQTVMSQSNCNKEEAIGALKESNGNLAEAILKLREK